MFHWLFKDLTTVQCWFVLERKKKKKNQKKIFDLVRNPTKLNDSKNYL